MSPRRATHRPVSRYRGDRLVAGLTVALGVLIVGYGIVGAILADYLARGAR